MPLSRCALVSLAEQGFERLKRRGFSTHNLLAAGRQLRGDFVMMLGQELVDIGVRVRHPLHVRLRAHGTSVPHPPQPQTAAGRRGWRLRGASVLDGL